VVGLVPTHTYEDNVLSLGRDGYYGVTNFDLHLKLPNGCELNT
jgi:hypothetical protein